MNKPKLLDLFCKAGGCGKGYADAGFDVTGVDIEPQPRYPFTFIQADALEFPLDGFDVIHASPPCQAYTTTTSQFRIKGKVYPDLLEIVRARLQASGKPWVIENVQGSPMEYYLMLCGSMFDLQVRRHRQFETSMLLFAPTLCRHNDNFVTIFGGEIIRQKRNPAYTGPKCGVRSNLRGHYPLEIGQKAMGINWMDEWELSQAIPPAYTKYVGDQIMEVVYGP